ncbi:P1 family peptidase [Microvirga sp. W0021]|uniref:P1 family peptidase n=1 Tax=Hohaiivirga grylli TaxID=3133970 RepID=A0ABV0BPK2_9HYPH
MAALKNLITDVEGLSVGNAHDVHVASGVTAILFDKPTVASSAVLGGAAATRDRDCLEPDASVPGVNAIVFSGGSGFGLDAASGVQAYLREQNIGFAVGGMIVPIVPQAILFDLLNGGNKDWGRYPPYRELGFAAAEKSAPDFTLGNQGAGYGATTANLKGGLGSASAQTSSGLTVGALVAVNALGSTTIGDSQHFWAAPLEQNGEFGGLGFPSPLPANAQSLIWKGHLQPATTIALVATDAILTKAQAKRLAIAAHDGLARALRLAHAPMDGDTVFSAATAKKPLRNEVDDMVELCALGADCLSRAIARGVFEAETLPFPDAAKSWRDTFKTKN